MFEEFYAPGSDPLHKLLRYCAANFPGTKQICRDPSLFAGISMIFWVIPRNLSEMEFWYQQKVFVAGPAYVGK